MFGSAAVEALVQEYQQLDDLDVFEPMKANTLTREQKLQSLNVIDLIKQKMYGKIKGRSVVDGKKQRDLYTKAEVSSPALSLEGFLATLTIDALEERHVAIADVAWAFLKADINDFVVVKL